VDVEDPWADLNGGSSTRLVAEPVLDRKELNLRVLAGYATDPRRSPEQAPTPSSSTVLLISGEGPTDPGRDPGPRSASNRRISGLGPPVRLFFAHVGRPPGVALGNLSFQDGPLSFTCLDEARSLLCQGKATLVACSLVCVCSLRPFPLECFCVNTVMNFRGRLGNKCRGSPTRWI